MIKVFGHKSPDTDATCAAIAYAWYSNQKGEKAESYVLGDLNKETKFVLKTAGIETPKKLEKLSEGDEVVIVDTNNPDELPEDLSAAKIIKIIDHHKLAGLTTNSPLSVYMKPVGCTSTLLYQIFTQNEVTPSKEIATLLLSATLSDTLNFTSPTSTEEDKTAATQLAKIAELNTEKHASAMFDAKSDLTGMSEKDILLSDSKVFEFNGKKVRISVLETTNPDNAKGKKDSLTKEISLIKSNEKLDGVFFFIVDIIQSKAELLTEEREIAEKAFEAKFEGDFLILDGVVSRKKQMAPKLEAVYS